MQISVFTRRLQLLSLNIRRRLMAWCKSFKIHLQILCRLSTLLCSSRQNANDLHSLVLWDLTKRFTDTGWWSRLGNVWANIPKTRARTHTYTHPHRVAHVLELAALCVLPWYIMERHWHFPSALSHTRIHETMQTKAWRPWVVAASPFFFLVFFFSFFR